MIEMNLDILIKKKGITQKELAEKTKIRQATLSAYCSGNYKHIVKEHINIFCEYFQCDINELIEYKVKEERKMEYYYEYKYAHSGLKSIPVWDYSKEITKALKEHYVKDLVEVCVTPSHYGFWIKREKKIYEQSQVGKNIADVVPIYNGFKKKYTYKNNDGTKGESTQIFIEDKVKRKVR